MSAVGWCGEERARPSRSLKGLQEILAPGLRSDGRCGSVVDDSPRNAVDRMRSSPTRCSNLRLGDPRPRDQRCGADSGSREGRDDQCLHLLLVSRFRSVCDQVDANIIRGQRACARISYGAHLQNDQLFLLLSLSSLSLLVRPLNLILAQSKVKWTKSRQPNSRCHSVRRSIGLIALELLIVC